MTPQEERNQLVEPSREWFREHGFMQDHKDEFRSNVTFQAVARFCLGYGYDLAAKRNVCDACLGTGTPVSGAPCMCGGSGLMSDAAIYLRERLVKVSSEVGVQHEQGNQQIGFKPLQK